MAKKKEEIVNNPIESKETISSETLYEKIQIEEVVKNKEEFKVDAPNYTVDNKDEKTDAVVEEVSPETTKKTKKTKSEDSKENEAQIIEEILNVEAQDKVTREIVIESKTEKKQRLKYEKKALKRHAKLKAKAIKIHRRRLKKNQTTLVRYETDPVLGLSTEAVEKRYIDNVVNKTEGRKTKTIPNIIFKNTFTFFNVLMVLIALVLISVNSFKDLFFLVIVTANTVIGIFQEIRAKKTIDRLLLISAPTAMVVRNGDTHEISVDEVVLDDLLLLDSGKQICADSIVVEGSVEVNESLLTGESDAIVKKPGDVLYSGSFVISGKCRARVDKVGKDNYVEQLTAQAKKYKKPKSDLLLSLGWIIKIMSVVVVVVGISLLLKMLGESFEIMDFIHNFVDVVDSVEFVNAIRKTAGAMIGMIPSGLLLTTSVALAVGVIRLSQRKVLVQELYCIEMLARVNCICLDKTGTITDGTMSVKNVIDYNTIHGLTSKNVISGILNVLDDGNLTSMALKEKFGNGKRMKYSASIPFSSQRKYQAVTFDKYGTFILGAPEFVLRDKFEIIKNDVNKYAAMGYRVLCLAHREGVIENGELPNSDVEIASIILIEDNIRPDAINTIKYFRESGVSVRVISGDNPLTVSKISQRAGVERADEYISLDGMTDQEVVKVATKYTVFGRVSPAQKRLLINTLKDSGLTVAMTGDGVNDILALKDADCSIAVASGSEAATNVSHLVLLDSNFDSMPKVVSEGRRVINNVTAVSALFLTKTIFSLLLAIQAFLTGAYPISTNQLILIDMLAIGIPAFFLVMEPNNNTVSGKFLFNVLKKALPGALVILLISIITFKMKDNLQLDARTLSTIIVIAATHTCLMVLFQTCKPFNSMRKLLFGACYSVFIVAILLGSKFLDFRPLLGSIEYINKDNISEVIREYPTVEISREGYYIIDGKVTPYYKNPAYNGNDVISVYEDGKYYYKVNDTVVYIEVEIPTITFEVNGNILLKGESIDNATYCEDMAFIVDENGILYKKGESGTLSDATPLYTTKYKSLYGYITPHQVKYSIIPTVDLKDGELVIGGQPSAEYKYKTKKTFTSLEDREITIDPETMELLIDGAKIYKVYNSNGYVSDETYKVSMPTVSYDINGTLYLGASYSGYNLSDIDNGNVNIGDISVIPGDAFYYLSLDGVTENYKTSEGLIKPLVATTKSGYYIIDGYITEYIATYDTLRLSVNAEGYLVIGALDTNYKIPEGNMMAGGQTVTKMPTDAFIFLIMLCLLSAPLMNVFKGFVPWAKKQTSGIIKLLSKI